jgi:hypothetical protein
VRYASAVGGEGKVSGSRVGQEQVGVLLLETKNITLDFYMILLTFR